MIVLHLTYTFADSAFIKLFLNSDFSPSSVPIGTKSDLAGLMISRFGLSLWWGHMGNAQGNDKDGRGAEMETQVYSATEAHR